MLDKIRVKNEYEYSRNRRAVSVVLLDRRLELGYSQFEIALRCDKDKSQISKMETKGITTDKQLKEILHAYELSYSEFIDLVKKYEEDNLLTKSESVNWDRIDGTYVGVSCHIFYEKEYLPSALIEKATIVSESAYTGLIISGAIFLSNTKEQEEILKKIYKEFPLLKEKVSQAVDYLNYYTKKTYTPLNISEIRRRRLNTFLVVSNAAPSEEKEFLSSIKEKYATGSFILARDITSHYYYYGDDALLIKEE